MQRCATRPTAAVARRSILSPLPLSPLCRRPRLLGQHANRGRQLATDSDQGPSETSVDRVESSAASTDAEKPKRRHPTLADLAFYRPADHRRGLAVAGSDETRAAAQRTVYELARRRLEQHFSKHELLHLVRKAELYGKGAEKLRKSEIIDLVVSEHWDIQDPDLQRRSGAFYLVLPPSGC